MITVIERKSYTQLAIAAGSDQVVCSMPIPPGGVFLGARATIHMVTSTHVPLATTACGFFAKSIITPLGGAMMDTALSVQTLFDQMVPKDIDLSIVAGSDEVDWDDGAITAPFEEPGHINWNDMMELGSRPVYLQEKGKLVSMASQGAKFPHVDTTDEVFMTGMMNMGTNKKVRVKQASYYLLAIASPSWDETTASVPTTIVDANWSALTYPDVMFDMMLPDILGLSEAGATSPFAEMAGFAVDLVEPSVFEEDTNRFLPITWTAWVQWAVRVATPGRPQMKGLTGGMPG